MRQRILLLFIITITAFQLKAQFGVSGQYTHYYLEDWEETARTNLHQHNYGIALDYWFRLRDYRWEMVPTISGHMGVNSEDEEGTIYNLKSTKFHFKNNFYILDFKGDCNCPTFSKQGGFLEKSLFLQVAPGYGLNILQTNSESIDLQDFNHLFELGLGAGLDIGLSDLITLSPYFNYVITTKTDHDYLRQFNGMDKQNMNYFVAGIRLGLRPDYARPNNIRRRNLRY